MIEPLQPVLVNVRPTSAGRALLAVVLVALFLSWAGLGVVFGVIATFGASVLAVAGAASWSRVSGLRIAAPGPVTAFAGEVFALDVPVANLARFADAFDVVLTVRGAQGERARIGSMLTRLAARAEVRIDVLYPALRRGRHPQGMIDLESASPLGLATCRVRFALPHEIVVLPRVGSLRRLERRDLRNRAHVVHGAASRGDEQEVRGLRAWREGESLRPVHWRLSARRGRLISREFGGELRPPVHVVLALALDASSHGARAAFEDAVSLAATLVEHHARRDHPVRLTLLGATATTLSCRRGRGGLVPALRALADAVPVDASAGRRLDEIQGTAPSGERVYVVRAGGTTGDRAPPQRGGGPVRVLDVTDRATAALFDRAPRPGYDILFGVRR